MRIPESWTRRQAITAGLAGLTVGRVGRAALPAGGWLGAGPLTETFVGGQVVLPDGSVAERDVRVSGGQIVEVGAPGSMGAGTDLSGKWLVPGFIDAACQVGLWEVGLEAATRDDAEDLGVSMPDVRVVDAYNAASAVVPVTRANGILTVVVTPSAGKLIAGHTWRDALVAAPVGLCLHLGRAGVGGEGGAKGRMGIALKLREIFESIEPEADEAPKRRRRKGAASPEEEDGTPAEAALRSVREGKMTALVQAERADDILRVIELRDRYLPRAVLVGGAEAHLVARELADADVPVLLGPLTVQPSSFEHLHARYDNAARLHAAGVRMAFRSASNHFARGLPTEVGVAMAHGLPHEAALHGLCRSAAEILELPGHEGIVEGAEAHFFVAEGDPLQPRHGVERVVVRGREASLETRQTQLYERFKEL